jgi:multisubunit Na+/H+ antiporter MnhC subunit
MTQFGSFKLHIVWASIFVFLFVVFLVGFSTSDGDGGFAIHAFGGTIPQNVLASMSDFADPIQVMQTILRSFIVWAVPFTFFLAAYLPLADAVKSNKFKNFSLDALFAVGYGFFYSQLLILPVWALCARIMGTIIPSTLALANFHSLILGLQLLIWSIIMNRLICSNRGIPMILALGLSAVGTKLYYFVDFGSAFGMSDGLVGFVAFLNNFLPSSHVPEDPIATGTILYGIVLTLALLALLVFFAVGQKSSPKEHNDSASFDAPET